MTPIVRNRGSAYHPSSCLLVEMISPLTGKSSSYVKNTHVVERISDAPIHSNRMVSFDEVSLFTKVPTDETLAVVQDKLSADPALEERTCIPIDNLMEILTFCAEITYFGIGSDIYRQEGLAMGSPLSPVSVNVYFEKMALRLTSLKPSMWFRYLDSTFIFIRAKGCGWVLGWVAFFSARAFPLQWRTHSYPCGSGPGSIRNEIGRKYRPR